MGELTYHVIVGKYNDADIMKLVEIGNGSTKLKTIAGGWLTISMKGENILKDEKSGEAFVTIKDVNQSNEVIYVLDHVMLPK